MENVRQVTKDYYWVGGSEKRLERFENLFPLTDGIAYNAYVLLDDKTILFDTVDQSITNQFMDNIRAVLKGRPLDYLVIHHMEPDHCSNIERIIELYPEVKLIGNQKTFSFLEQFYHLGTLKNFEVIKEGYLLETKHHKIEFFMTPMLHWPEVMMSYDHHEKLFFSADAFGLFGAHHGNLFADEYDFAHVHLDESRRYYSNIIGKFGTQVTNLLKKLEKYPIEIICPLHGPIYRTKTDIEMILQKYQTWGSYLPELKSVLFVYGSMYGNTEEAVNYIAHRLSEKGIRNIKIRDVSMTDASYIISDMWAYEHIVLASPNYNTGLYFKMDNLLREVSALGLKNRKYSIITNVTWGGTAQKVLETFVEETKDSALVGTPLIIKSSIDEALKPQIDALTHEIYKSLT